MAIGVIAVVMIVSRLRVTCLRDRPVRTAVSPKKCVVIICSLVVRAGAVGVGAVVGGLVGALVADECEEDVLESGLLLHVLDLGGRKQRLELGEGATDDDPSTVEDRDLVGELLGLVEVLGREQHCRAALR